MKRTKIVATIGPSTEERPRLQEMIERGMNVARLNFSHNSHQWHRQAIKSIREVSKALDVPVGIIADLQGPRIRVANTNEITVERNARVCLMGAQKIIQKSAEKNPCVVIDFPGVEKYLKSGERILIEDGSIILEVVGKGKNGIICRAVNSGIIRPKKGVNIPGISSRLEAITEKDKKDLVFALSQNVDFVALSFVSSAEDIISLRSRIKRLQGRKKEIPQIIAKIETRDAIQNFDEIVKATDVVMVARGDLGIEMPEEEVPVLQKKIIEKCLRSAKPVVVATQMLNSMITSPRPTRAEVSDVSNAVVDHADAVMLSGETATGKYPVEVIKVMSEIIKETEKSPFDDLPHGFLGDEKSSLSASVADAAHEMAKNSRAQAIVAASVSGFTARMVARHRPKQRLIVMTNSQKTHNQLSLIWGVESYVLSDCKDLDGLIDSSMLEIKRRKALDVGDKIVIVTGRPHVKREHMSLVKVQEIK